MSRRIIYLLLAVSLGINAGVIAMTLINRPAPPFQGPPAGPGDEGPGAEPSPSPDRLVNEHLRGMTRHLELDPEQQQAVRAVLERHAPQLIQHQREAAEAGRRLSAAFAAPEFDPGEFARLVVETSDARTRLDSLSAVMLTAEAVVLTPAQRVKFAEVAPIMSTSRQRPHQGDGPPPGDRPPPRRS